MAIDPNISLGVRPLEIANPLAQYGQIAAIQNEADYDRVVSFMNSLLDVVGDDEEHELADLLDLVGQLVEDYESTHHAIRDAGHPPRRA